MSTQFDIDKNGTLVVETLRSGHFTFQITLDFERLEVLRLLVEHAYTRFASLPLMENITHQLEAMTVVTAVYSTNTIEGGELNEQETAQVLADPQTVQNQQQQRVHNLQQAYGQIREHAINILSNAQYVNYVQGDLHLHLSEDIIKNLHAIITHNLDHEDNIAGVYRDNPKHRKTQVGDAEHGGQYTPPKCLKDIQLLIKALVAWANSPAVLALPPLYRAPLVHYYFERIHPFWDGNGRTGRVLEANLLQHAKYLLAPHAIARFYLQHIDRYFALFNYCRKQTKQKAMDANTEFVQFHLQGMLDTVNHLHDKANGFLATILLENHLRFLEITKVINVRQYTILTQIHATVSLQTMTDIQQQPWYNALYKQLTLRTQKRDWQVLINTNLLKLNSLDHVSVVPIALDIQLSTHPVTAVKL
jgi:Fic family protein